MSVFTTAMSVLDEATAEVAWGQLGRLQSESEASNHETALAILHALKELEKLRTGGTPDYDYPWLPPLYALWYQSSHTQMAYHITGAIPSNLNPFHDDGPSSLHLIDFACGTMAMQFGTAIAAAELLESSGRLVTINITSSDLSSPMWSFGRELWLRFYARIVGGARNQESKLIREACHRDRFVFANSEAPVQVDVRWLTALHAAYGDGHNEIKTKVNGRVRSQQPDVVAITAHSQRVQLRQAYMPTGLPYEDASHIFGAKAWPLQPFASKVDDTRAKIFEERIQDINGVSDKEKVFAKDYLVNDSLRRQRNMPQRTSRMLYVRKDA